jgi:hypothetical protein
VPSSPPVAVIAADPAFGVVGSVVKLDGRGSSDPDSALLSYTWSFESVPIGSKVSLEGFKTVEAETDPAAPVVGSPMVVSFSPDIVGEYVVGLIASDGVNFSPKVTQVISIRAIMIPHGRGLVPDGKFIWSYIRDIWQQVEDKEWFETLWSALLQIAGADLLNLYQTDYNKSIRDIQDQVQRRWLSYEPKLALDQDDISFIFDNQQAGVTASTNNALLGISSSVDYQSSFAVPYNNGVGDLSSLAAGRIVLLGGRPLKITRQHVYSYLGTSYTLVTSDVDDIPTGMSGVSWRAAHTLISKNNDFDALGVSAGDLMMVEVSVIGSQLAVDVPAQVIGVLGNRLAFVLTDQPVLAGVIANIPNQTYLDISESFGINTVAQTNGVISFSGFASILMGDMQNGLFKTNYFNKELTPESVISGAGLHFSIRPKHIIRNRFLPVDANLMSVPLLQRYIKQPELGTKTDGSFVMIRGDRTISVETPQWLSENVDYLIDDEFVADEKLTFAAGTAVINAPTADFIDRNMLPGDTFTIVTPTILAGDYPIKSVVSPTQIQLAKAVPTYPLGGSVTARVQLKRRKTGNFIRFVPGRFTAASPAPDRLWAEVSFFDNNPAIEDNFGILVGLKREDLDNITTNVTYRQAVTGLMYALTRGSAVSKIELGVKILLGLPFSEHRGIIRSIDGNYRLDGVGTPILGRLLIEDVDDNDIPLGTMRVYTYPIDATNTELSGVDTNPATGVAYAVGDLVEKLVSLSRGVEVTDYQTEPVVSGILQHILQQFHTFKVKINANIFTIDEFKLVSDFLQKITPSYVSYMLPLIKTFSDSPVVTDAVTERLSYTAVDDASFGLSFATALDQRYKSGSPVARLGQGFMSRRRTGTDLVVAANGFVATSAAGGFLNPKAGESFDGSLCKAGDRLVIFDGPNADVYQISSLTDGSLTTYTTGDFRNCLALWHCDEASGNLVDAMGQFTLTPTGSPTAVTGLLNGGRGVSNGNAFSASVADTSFLDAVLRNGAWTVKLAFWIDPSVVGSTFPGAGNGDGTILSFAAARMLIGLGANGTLRYYNSTSNNSETKNDVWTNLPRSTWHRLAVRSTLVSPTKCNIDFFLNGTLIQTNYNVLIPTSFPATPTMTIGGESVAFDCFKGQVDEIEFWNYPQTDEEIRMGGKKLVADTARFFTVVRPVDNLIRSGTCSITFGNTTVSLGAGLRTDGVQPGDLLYINDVTGGRRRFSIVSVDNVGGQYSQVTVDSTMLTSGSFLYRIVRPSLIDSPTFENFLGSSSSGFIIPALQFLAQILDPGDEIQNDAISQRMIVTNPTPGGLTMLFNNLPDGSYIFKVVKRRRPKSPISFDHKLLNDPLDTVDLTVIHTAAANAVCTAGSGIVSISGTGPYELGARLGDFLVLVGGSAGSANIGYGLGAYPISSLSAGSVVLAATLPANETLNWKLKRTR